MSASYEPPPTSSSASVDTAPDPVVAMVESFGHVADPRVAQCGSLAAAAHAQRYADRRADGPEVNRSTLLWAVGRVDDTVRAGLRQGGVEVDALADMLGISEDLRTLTESYGLAAELTRALQTFLERTSGKIQATITPWSLAIAIVEDVVAHGGLLGERLDRLGARPDALIESLRRAFTNDLAVAEPDADGGPDGRTGGAPLPRMREVTPLRFGVQLPRGSEPLPYVRRDADDELDRQLREGQPVVTLVAPPVSGAIRTAYEALLRERPDDRVLLLHEVLEGRSGPDTVRDDEFEGLLASGAEVVWVRNLGDLLREHPALESWFRGRGDAVAATIVLIVRPDDVERAAGLGLLSARPVELRVALSADEQARAQASYEGDVTEVASFGSATVRRAAVRRANYAADSASADLLDEVDDVLDIRGDVDMLARLIASKDVHPPLSIGLFGPWGSGKSFIMKQVQLRIDRLAGQSKVLDERNAEATRNGRTADVKETGYLGEILPVEFNAWQYAHGEALWASLINRVFEQIRERLTDDKRYQEMLQDLADKDEHVAQARRRVSAAQDELSRTTPAAADRVIKDVAADHEMGTRATSQIEATLDVDVAKQQVSDLRAEYERLTRTGARVRKGWQIAPGWRRVAVVALAVVAVGAGLLFWAAPDAFAHVSTAVAGVLSAVVSVLTGLIGVLRPVNQGLDQAAKLLRADDADKERLRRAQDDLVRATEALAAARTSGLAGLYGFVSDRSAAAEYRQHLGMAPMIRDDLAKLASLAKGSAGTHGIERIVIFIDDLDRCPAKEVIRVLEAVNLLFGFELFVVVVAVDSRWLVRSLDGQFSEAFDKKDPEAPTPLNYLEKIIQIPFWVQPMDAGGFGKLVTSLAGEVDESPAADVPDGRVGEAGEASRRGMPSGDGRNTVPPTDQVSHGSETSPVGPLPVTPGPMRGGVSGGPTDRGSGSDAGGGTGDGAGRTPVVGEAEEAEDLNPAALRLTSAELAAMTRFLPLVGTPRAVKRFLNTYQLLRVSVDDVDAFLQRKEYEPVLVLLALMTGTSRLDDGMVRQLKAMGQPNLAAFLSTLPERPGRGEEDAYAGWRLVSPGCQDLPTEQLTQSIVDTWMPMVARYSFHAVDV